MREYVKKIRGEKKRWGVGIYFLRGGIEIKRKQQENIFIPPLSLCYIRKKKKKKENEKKNAHIEKKKKK